MAAPNFPPSELRPVFLHLVTDWARHRDRRPARKPLAHHLRQRASGSRDHYCRSKCMAHGRPLAAYSGASCDRVEMQRACLMRSAFVADHAKHAQCPTVKWRPAPAATVPKRWRIDYLATAASTHSGMIIRRCSMGGREKDRVAQSIAGMAASPNTNPAKA
jgi:hypothetical protein